MWGPHFFNQPSFLILKLDKVMPVKSFEMWVGLLPILEGCCRFWAISSDESTDRIQEIKDSSLVEGLLPGSKMLSRRNSFIK